MKKDNFLSSVIFFPSMNKKVLIVFCILLSLFLLLFSYKVVLHFTDLNENQQQTIDFLQNKEELKLNYTTAEVSHLVDVKSVIKFSDYLFYFLLLVLTLIITCYKKNKKLLQKLFLYGGITTVAFILFILLFSLLFFDISFNLFHQIFFPQGNWIFSTDSLLIQTFPIEFFMTISRNIFLLSFVFGSIFILSQFLLKYVHSNKRY